MKKIAAKQKKIATEGLVIKTIDQGESNRLIVILTKDIGVITAFAGGVRKPTSKLASGSGIFVYSSFNLTLSGDKYRVEEAVPIELFYNLRSDILKVACASYFCDIISEISPPGDSGTEYLPVILNALHLLSNTEKSVKLIKTVTEMRFMMAAGFAPNLCEASCGHNDGEICFDYLEGTLICRACSYKIEHFNGTVLNKTMLDTLKFITENDAKKVYNFTIPDKDLDYLNTVTENYIIAVTERRFKTLDFLKSVM